MIVRSLGLLNALLALALAACHGVVEAPGAGGAPSDGAGPAGGAGSGGSGGGAVMLRPAPRAVVSRLNVAEYDNTLRDLFGTSLRLPASFPPDDTAYGFDNVGQVLSLTDVHLGHYRQTARAVVAEALSGAGRARLVPCNLATQHDTCARTALQAFLPRAWRRPVADADVADLVGLYAAARADGNSDDDALAFALQAALLSPRFLFRLEVDPPDAVGKMRDLDGYEVASRLSYLLWSSMPDDDLFRAAAAGELADAAGLAAQARRMLADGKARALVDGFGAQWLPVRKLDVATPDPKTFPAFDDELRQAMQQETLALFADVARGALPANQIFTPGYAYLNDDLAAHYGLPAVGSAVPVKTTVPPGRGGLLTQGTLLTAMAHPTETAPVARGKWMLSQVLCKDVPPPPPNIPEEPPAMDGQTRRSRLAAHRTEPLCASCHSLMDPLGLALEQYDGIGKYRTTDQGAAIEPGDVLPDGRSFAGPVELERMLATDAGFPACLAGHVFTYAVHRAADPASTDRRVLEQAVAKFQQAGQRLPDLLEALVLSDAFRKTGVEVMP